MATHRGFSVAVATLFASIYARPTFGATLSLVDSVQPALEAGVSGAAAAGAAAQTNTLVSFVALAQSYQLDSE
jgi:hypothetical protein